MDPAADLDEGQVLRVSSLNQGEVPSWHSGLWSETEPPPALRDSLREPQRYLQAIRQINSVERESWVETTDRLLTGLLFIMIPALLKMENFFGDHVAFFLFVQLFIWRFCYQKIPLYLLQRAVGEANVLLWPEDVLIGCESTMELLVARVPLSACREQLGRRFDYALTEYSCQYVCCLAQRNADPAPPPEAPCFCQYALKHL